MLTVVAAALIDAHGNILVQKRAAGRAMAGLWEFPGGKMEEGETPQEALTRELREELGIDVSPDALVPSCFASEALAGQPMLLLLFLCHSWKGEPRLLDACELRWMRAEDLVSLEMPPADIPLVKMLVPLLAHSALG
jgi:8-oxo-dGTP diphosphatase